MAKHEAEIFEYNGEIFRRYPTSPNISDASYYKISRTNKKHDYLHRLIYKDHYGEIPEGFHVHHIDGNCSNNDPSNLMCVDPEEHARLHPWDDDRKARQSKHLDDIRDLTKAWHSSEEGLEFHRKIGPMWKNTFVPQEKICLSCNSIFLTKQSGHQDIYCSNACKSAYRRKSGVDNVEKTCICCGGAFIANKYARAKTCSRACGQLLRRKKDI